jgi:hypothetical protein
VRVVFAGEISNFIEDKILKNVSIKKFPEYDCVDLRGKVSDSEFKDDIVPTTRAVLNPFLEKVQSGISVKSWEAIANTLPLITSKEGLHGLGCAEKTLSRSGHLYKRDTPGETKNFMDFVVKNALNPRRYLKWVSKVKEARAKCLAQQKLTTDFCTAAAR